MEIHIRFPYVSMRIGYGFRIGLFTENRSEFDLKMVLRGFMVRKLLHTRQKPGQFGRIVERSGPKGATMRSKLSLFETVRKLLLVSLISESASLTLISGIAIRVRAISWRAE